MTRPRLVSRSLVALAIAAAALLVSAPAPTSATAPTVTWASWTTPTYDNYVPYTHATSANGQITMPDGSTVYLRVTGEITYGLFGVAGSSWWSTVSYAGSGEAFRSANVPNLPTNSDHLQVVGTAVTTQTVSFYSDSARTTPVNVSNIVMPLYSLGGSVDRATWDFVQEPTILSDNRNVSSYHLTKSSVGGKYRLRANEGTGTLQFAGTYNSISWDITEPEAFSAWTIGATTATAPQPALTASRQTVTGLVNEPITKVTLAATTFNVDVTYSITSGSLPAGLDFNASTGEITGTPTETASAVDVVFKATDGYNEATTTVTFTFTRTPITATLYGYGMVSLGTVDTTVGGTLAEPDDPPAPAGKVFLGWALDPVSTEYVTFPFEHGMSYDFGLYAIFGTPGSGGDGSGGGSGGDGGQPHLTLPDTGLDVSLLALFALGLLGAGLTLKRSVRAR